MCRILGIPAGIFAECTLSYVTAVNLEVPVTTEQAKRTRRLGMRWKLLIAFGLVFTAFFVVLAIWIVQFSTNSANSRLKDTLRSISEGGARALDVDALVALQTASLPITPGDVYPENSGTIAGTTLTNESLYPAAAAYWAHVNELANIRRTNPEASPYTYYVDGKGVVRAIGSWGALGYPNMGIDQPAGFRFQEDVTAVIDETTLGYFKAGFEGTTFQPAYTDALSRWISVYTPIRDSTGKVVGAIGVDYDMAYVGKVRRDVQRSLYPVFAVAYVLLLGLVFLLSGQFAKRISRLNSATRKVAEGNYEVDISSSAAAVFPDEMTELANSFLVMTKKVGERERTLTQTVQVLRVEIDEAKRRDAVSEIVDSDFFNDLTKKAGAMRAKVKGAEIIEAAAERAAAEGTKTDDE